MSYGSPLIADWFLCLEYPGSTFRVGGAVYSSYYICSTLSPPPEATKELILREGAMGMLGRVPISGGRAEVEELSGSFT